METTNKATVAKSTPASVIATVPKSVLELLEEDDEFEVWQSKQGVSTRNA